MLMFLLHPIAGLCTVQHGILCTSILRFAPVQFVVAPISVVHRVRCEVPFRLKLHFFLVCHRDLVKHKSTGIMVATQQPDFAGELLV